jgi:hypothetical protein
VFGFNDIKEELLYYEKTEMTSFQKINMFINSFSNDFLSNYINDCDASTDLGLDSDEC